jgi:hypothetical protein
MSIIKCGGIPEEGETVLNAAFRQGGLQFHTDGKPFTDFLADRHVWRRLISTSPCCAE